MRIVLVVPGGVGADGVRAVIPALLSLVRRLSMRHDVLVVATDQVAEPASYRLEGAAILALGRRRRGLLGRPGATAAAISAIRGFQPDVIHAIWLGPSSTIAILGGALARVPVVASVGGGELVALPRIEYGGARTWRRRGHAALALRRASVVTAGSRLALEPLLVRRPDSRWLPLGAERDDPPDAPVALPPDSGPGPERPLRLVVAASINRVKGPELVLGAVARARASLGDAVRLEWLGEDTLGGSTAGLARALGIDRAVAFAGFQPHAAVRAAWRSADLAVQGSYHESQGVAVLEAAAAGVPTVGTAVGLVAELARTDPPAAVAVPVGDAAALGDAIVALARDPERRVRLGRAARAWAEEHDADWTARALASIYTEVTRGRPAGR
ncbi:MAG: glycosyltransferase [Chloroflexota bacterium]|nr:MAG: glycosyltransferase [Chloroflexota bacterium]